MSDEEVESVAQNLTDFAIPEWMKDSEAEEIQQYAEIYSFGSAAQKGDDRRWKILPLCGKAALTPSWQTLSAPEGLDEFMKAVQASNKTRFSHLKEVDGHSVRFYHYRKKQKDETWRDIDDPLNIGLCTGLVNGFLVLDVDLKNRGLESLQSLLAGADLEEMPLTWTTITGSGGFHYYFQYDPDFSNATNIGGYSGLDLKTDGGYVVAPGSTHPTTMNYYRWHKRKRTLESRISSNAKEAQSGAFR